MGGKIFEQGKLIPNFENFYRSREELFNFFRGYAKMMLKSIQI